MQKFGNVSLGKITNVRTRAGDKNCYFCEIELQENNLKIEIAKYVALHDDTAQTGQWVYQQITKGNFEGSVVDVPANVDPFTLEPLPDYEKNNAKRERNMRLAATDWTQTADIPQATKDKWTPYRQALRDVPQQPGFPKNIVWPTPPQ